MGVERYTVKTHFLLLKKKKETRLDLKPPNPFAFLLLSLPSLSVSPFFYISVEKGRHKLIKAQWKKVSSLFVVFF
jgi:hypothetical protein